MKVSIIIANYNSEKYIVDCLKSVFTLRRAQGYSFEVIVVDSGSSDRSVELIKEKFGRNKRLRLVELKENKGPTYSRNLGVRKSKGKYLVFLDNDTVVDKDWLKKTVKFMEENRDVGAGQLKLLRMDRKSVFDSAGDKISPLGFLAERAREAVDKGQFDYPEEIISGKGAAILVKKKVFDQVGGLDEDLFMYWEEPDLLWRVWKSGFRVVFLWMGKVWHAYGTKIKKVAKDREVEIVYLGCRNQLMTILKNGVGWRLWQMLISVVLAWGGLLFIFLIKFDFKKAGAVIKAWWWLIKNWKLLLKRRQRLQKRLGKRFYSDKEWMNKVMVKRGLNWYWGKGINYILGRPF